MTVLQPYATAIQRTGLPEADSSLPVSAFENQYGYGFAHDILLGLPAKMMEADVMYADLPYQKGYAVFYGRAGRIPTLPYSAFLEYVGAEVRKFGKPAYIVGPKISPKYLRPDGSSLCTLSGLGATLSYWKERPSWEDGANTADIITALASKYFTVADPLCGYGKTARGFVEAGKRFIVSDLNAEYIGWIAANSERWVTTE